MVRKVAFGCEWPHKQNTCQWIFNLMQHRVKVRVRYLEVPGMLPKMLGEMKLALQG
jgi:hypothetical protein